MPFFRSRGLSFRRKRKKVTLTAARSMALLIGEIAITLFIAFVLVYCVGMKVTVVGNSMEDTLTDGESVLVNRFTYNLTDPKSGDVVVFTLNENDDSHYYIKRVVAVPGDTVQIRDGILYVNGEMLMRRIQKRSRTPGWRRRRSRWRTASFLCWAITATAARTAGTPISAIFRRTVLQGRSGSIWIPSATWDG